MEQEKVVKLLLRQLKDIQIQADKILSGNNSSETIESFARYSTDLKEYIAKNVENKEVISYLAEIPNVNYSRNKFKPWLYLILPAWLYLYYKDIIAKNRSIEEISIVKGKYACLELLIMEVLT